VQAGNVDIPMKLAILNNDVLQAECKATQEPPMAMTNLEKTQNNNEWHTCHERDAQLVKNGGQAFSLVLEQCTQPLQDKMKQDAEWNVMSTSYDPLKLHRLIEKTMLAQMEDQCPFATVCEQEQGFCSFRQELLSNPQCCERFNTKVDVASAIGTTRQCQVSLEFVAQEMHGTAARPVLFKDLDSTQQQEARQDAKERHLACVFLRQSGAQHSPL